MKADEDKDEDEDIFNVCGTGKMLVVVREKDYQILPARIFLFLRN